MAMNRRAFLQTSACLTAGLLTGRPAWGQDRPPNVVFILVDDLGWRDVGCYGSSVFETPHIDRLADEGMRFTQAYANCPVCSPSRAALMTGKNPARIGFTGHITAILAHRHPEGSRILPPDDRQYLAHEEVTLAEAVKAAGYTSASIGKWHLGQEGYWPTDHGFDVNVAGWTHGSPPDHFYPYEAPDKPWNPSIPTMSGGEPGEYLTDRLTDEAIAFVREHRDRPFFLYLTHYAVHTPLQAPEELVEKYRNKLDGTEGVDPIYAAMVESLDTNVGRLLAEVDALGLTDNTLVVFYSDNGGLSSATNNAPLREGKAWLYEGGIRVPLIVKWPGTVAPGAVCDAPVIGSDLYLTICEAAGSKSQPGTDLDAVSLMPLLEGADHIDREPMVWYYPHYGLSMRPGAALRKGDYKVIEWYDPQGVELYNLADDPSETRDLASAMPERAEAMRAELEAYLDRVNTIRHRPNPDYTGE